MRYLTRAVLALLLATPLACSAAESAPFKLGQHYRAVGTVQPPTDPTRIDVAEVFWYGCPHCFQFEPYVERYLERKPADVNFIRLPSSLGRPVGILHSKAFYAAELLGVTDRIHKPLFGAMHGQGRMLATPDEIRQFFIAHAGINGEDFDGAFTGFAVDSRVRRTETAIREMGITSVPTVVVGGRYMTNGTMAGGHEKVLEVVEFLVKKVREERKKR
jgi:protein dithiol oxidoreductase (disulfide-forming)